MVFLLNGKKNQKKRIMREKYLIYVSNYLSHKNHLSLLKFQNYFNYKILLVGKPTEATGKKTYETLKKNKNFKFFFNVSEVELQSLVKNSEFVLFPSKLEGFGIPIIEALSQKKNILIEKDLKKQLPIFSKCKKLFFHDFSKRIDSTKIKKLLSKITCKKCIYKSFQWKKSVDDLEKIIKKNIN